MLLQACGQSESLTLTLVHYNVGVFSKTDSSSVAVVADAVRELRADVVSLNELDNMVFRTGLKDQLALFSSEMGGWNSVFAPAMPFQGGRYGVGLSAKPGLELLRMDKVRLPESNPISLVKRTWQQLSPSQPTDLVYTDLSTASDHLPVMVNVTIKRLHP